MDDSGITVVSVLWVGDFRKRSYSPEWVRRLRNMVARNLATTHRFVCFSNVKVDDIETIPIPDHPPGWWAKVRLFERPLADRCLFLDLDTLVVGDLTPLVDTDKSFIAAPHSSRWKGEGNRMMPGTLPNLSSCALSWSGNAGAEIYREFSDVAMHQYRGDQDWMGAVMGRVPTFPPEWFLKLKRCTKAPPDGVKLIASMPWKNDEAARKFEWVNRIWR